MNTTDATVRPIVSITLFAASLGTEATEADFDAWAAYVAANIDDAFCSQSAAQDVT